MAPFTRSILPGLLTALIAVAGCAGYPAAPVGTQAVDTGASLSGLALAPSSLVANNTGSLVANNSGGLVSNNVAGYRVAAAQDQLPLPNAVVYVTDTADRFYKGSDNKPLSASTDASGQYAFVGGVPVNVPVIVSVILSQDRREVGFTVPKVGKNTVDVSVASTYVTEFLRYRAAQDGKQMSDYPVSELGDLADRTSRAIASGSLSVPSLKIADITTMNMAYALVIGRNVEGLGDAWGKLLGERVIAMETFAGNGDYASSGDGRNAVAASLYTPKGLATDAAGSVYVCEESGNKIRRIAPNGTITTVAGTGAKGYNGDGPANVTTLNWPRTLTVGPDGNLYFCDTLNMAIRVLVLNGASNIGTTFGKPWLAGNIYTIAGTPQNFSIGAGSAPNAHTGDGGPSVLAQLAGPRGIAFAPNGDLYFADSWGWPAANDDQTQSWHFIRRIDHQTGNIFTVVGQVSTAATPSFGFSPDGTPAAQAHINYPQQLVIDAQNHLYFTETSNNDVRLIDLNDPRMPLKTVLGNSAGTKISQPLGVAVGKDGTIYVSCKGDAMIRAVLPNGSVRLLAGGGSLVTDGDGPMLSLTQPHDLTLDAAGNLLVADARANRVRRLLIGLGL